MDKITRTIFKNEISGYVIEKDGDGTPKLVPAGPITRYSTSKLLPSEVAKIAKEAGFVTHSCESRSEKLEMSLEKFVEHSDVYPW